MTNVKNASDFLQIDHFNTRYISSYVSNIIFSARKKSTVCHEILSATRT